MNAATQVWVDETLKPLVPVSLCLFLVLLTALPYRISGLAAVMPHIVLMAVFYWSLARPDLVPVGAIFAVGLLQDIVTGGPLGGTAMVLMLVRVLIVTQRRVLADKPFYVAWTGFAIVAVGAEAAAWLLAGAYYGTIPDPRPAFVQLLITIAFYPALALFFGRLRMAIIRV